MTIEQLEKIEKEWFNARCDSSETECFAYARVPELIDAMRRLLRPQLGTEARERFDRPRPPPPAPPKS